MGVKFIVSVECAIEYNDRFLIIQRPAHVHAGGMLAFPGGGFEVSDGQPNRDALMTAAKREVFEEVGLELVDPINYITSSCFIDKYDQYVVHVVFHCKLQYTKLELKISEREIAGLFWLTIPEAKNYENCPEWLARYLDLIAISSR